MIQKFKGILCVLPRNFVKYDGNNRRRFDREEFLEVTTIYFFEIHLKYVELYIIMNEKNAERCYYVRSN